MMVVVIGAGPAGLAAARAARRRGADVTIVDSSSSTGGQFWRHLSTGRTSTRERSLHHKWALYQEMDAELQADPKCTILLEATVFALEPIEGRPPRVQLLAGPTDGAGRQHTYLDPDSLVIATGAYDRTLPFPGWQLPGVFTAGGAQSLAKGERISVGRRVLIAGTGPFLLPVAASVASTGANVLRIVEGSRISRLARGWLSRPWEILALPSKLVELLGYVRILTKERISYAVGRAVVAAHGEERLEAVTVARVDHTWRPIPGTERRIQVDALCVTHGFSPRLELPIAAGCALRGDTVCVDADQQSTVARVYIAGELTGIAGVDASLAEGEIAGHCAAGGRSGDLRLSSALRRRRQYNSFARRLEAAHPIGESWHEWMTEDTIVCRCEEVRYGSICAVMQQTESRSLRSLKLTTRVGLGVCQGRMCGTAFLNLIAENQHYSGQLVGEIRVDKRLLTTPLRLGELASVEVMDLQTFQLDE